MITLPFAFRLAAGDRASCGVNMRARSVVAAAVVGLLATTPAYAKPMKAKEKAVSQVATKSWSQDEIAKLDAALAHPRRDSQRARDKYRHPKETLMFFDVRAGMTVAEYMPLGGWYSTILAPYLGENGKLIGLQFLPEQSQLSDAGKASVRRGSLNFPTDVERLTGVPAARVGRYFTSEVPADMNGTVDRILIIRFMHNLFNWNIADSEIRRMRDMLKDDGLIGIVQHRADKDSPYNRSTGASGYLREADVISFMETHGFEPVSSSEVNANSSDTKDYPRGVWTLPPNFAEGETDRAKYEAIGESDRMTLLFRKRL